MNLSLVFVALLDAKVINFPYEIGILAQLTSEAGAISLWQNEVQLDSQLDGIITTDGKIQITNFRLGEERFDNATAHSCEEIMSD